MAATHSTPTKREVLQRPCLVLDVMVPAARIDSY